MSNKVLESNNYRMFELWEANRDVTKIKKLMKSMQTYGWIDSKPMSVIRTGNGKLKIRDGHHRFEVAQQLGIPVKYVIDTDSATPHEIEEGKNYWTMRDCLTSYCRAGKIEYLKVKTYCDETGIGLGLAASMLMGESAGSGNYHHAFRTGVYKTRPGTTHADVVRSLVVCFRDNGIKFYNAALLVQALSKCVWVDQFSPNEMKSKIKKFPYIVEKKANMDQYLTMLEELYNWKSKAKIPLKYLAIEKGKDRLLISQKQEDNKK